jgi:hypothetical protein
MTSRRASARRHLFSYTADAVMDYVKRLEAHLAARHDHAVVSRIGPRYVSLKEGLIDLYRVYHSMEEAISGKRDDPRTVLIHLIAVAGQTMKIADDVSFAAGIGNGVSSVDPETVFRLLIDEESEDGR